MSNFKLEIECDNAAFHDDNGDFDPGNELATILRTVQRKVADGYQVGMCHDSNGNLVGSWGIAE